MFCVLIQASKMLFDVNPCFCSQFLRDATLSVNREYCGTNAVGAIKRGMIMPETRLFV